MIIPVKIKLITEIKENPKVGQDHSDYIIIPLVNRDINGAKLLTQISPLENAR